MYLSTHPVSLSLACKTGLSSSAWKGCWCQSTGVDMHCAPHTPEPTIPWPLRAKSKEKGKRGKGRVESLGLQGCRRTPFRGHRPTWPHLLQGGTQKSWVPPQGGVFSGLLRRLHPSEGSLQPLRRQGHAHTRDTDICTNRGDPVGQDIQHWRTEQLLHTWNPRCPQ